MEQSIVMWGTIIIFNLAILQLPRVTLGQADFHEAMNEKSPATSTTTIMQAAPAQPLLPAPAGVAPLPATVPMAGDKQVTTQPVAAETSYSRVAGMIGAVVLACFVWAVGNVILYKMFVTPKPQDVTDLVASLSSYFLAAASLFAPYAVNQLGGAFKSK